MTSGSKHLRNPLAAEKKTPDVVSSFFLFINKVPE